MNVPAWEFDSGFNPTSVQLRKVSCVVDCEGSTFQVSPPTFDPLIDPFPSGQSWHEILHQIKFLDPNYFIAGQLHEHLPAWEILLAEVDNTDSALVRRWLNEKIDVKQFMKPYKGNFGGVHYNSSSPERRIFQNYQSCEPFKKEIAETLMERIANGSIELLGRVGEVPPPHLVMPLVMVGGKSKPRLCHDERYLNLYMQHCPFTLEGLSKIPHMLEKNDLMSLSDEKSAYDGVLLSEDSRTYFGLEFAGWYMQYRTLPFGWSVSPFIYQTIGMQVTTYLRKRGLTTLQYLDDRFLGPMIATNSTNSETSTGLSIALNASVLTHLGYTLALHKCVWEPSAVIKYLGFMVHANARQFRIPIEKKEKFRVFREDILESSTVHLKTLQQFMGKCISFSHCVPAAKLYIRVMANSISKVQNSTRLIPIVEELREEIEFWRFIDSHTEWSPWRQQKHVELTIATDASGYAWGATVGTHKIHDFWEGEDSRPIHLKESDALIHALEAVPQEFQNKRVDALIDNQALVKAWEKLGSKDLAMNKLLVKLFEIVKKLNCELKMTYIPSAMNPADAPSRALSLADSRLSTTSWNVLQKHFGPHSFDLMALDSNCMCDSSGLPLPHYTPFPLPGSRGVNVLCQSLAEDQNYYCFPPFCMAEPVVTFLLNECTPQLKVTLVLPKYECIPFWEPKLVQRSVRVIQLGNTGDMNVIETPTKRGFRPSSLKQPLQAFRIENKN